MNIASEPEHADESACSLRFGARMSRVANVATKLVGVDAGDETVRLSRQVAAMKSRLASMRAAGLGGGWNESGNSSEKQSIKANMQRLAEAKVRVDELRMARIEAGSQIGSMATAHHARVPAQETQAVKAYEILRDIVGRQKTIKALYREPKPAFVTAEAELAGLEQRLAALARR